MCNAANKLAILALAALAMASCSKDPDKIAADELVANIETAVEQGDYQTALALMDSVNQKYPSQIEARKKVTALKPKIIEMASLRQIETADSILAFTQADIEQMQSLFKHVSGDDLEGYYVVADAGGKFINNTGMEARVNDSDFRFYIVAQVSGKKPGISQAGLKAGSAEMKSEPLPASTGRRMDIEGSELATFLPEEVFDLGEWAWQQGEAVNGGFIVCANGTQNVKMTPAQAASYGKAWRFSQLKMKYANALELRKKLERQLDIARQQGANVSDIPEK